MIDELHNLHMNEIKQINADDDSVEMQLSSLMSCAEFSRKVIIKSHIHYEFSSKCVH